MNALLLRLFGCRLTSDRFARWDSWRPDVDLLSILVRWRLDGAPLRVVLQIGANDGLDDDPVRRLIVGSQCRCVLVEPMPSAFRRLSGLYQGHARVVALQAAVDTTSSTRPIYSLRRVREGVSEEATVYSSFDRDVVARRAKSMRGYRLVSEPVRTIAPSDLVREHVGAQIDLLQVDTEGHDANVVHAFLDAAIHPTMVNFEHIHLTGRTDQDLLRRLRATGYRCVRYGMDTFCAQAGPRPAEGVSGAVKAACGEGRGPCP